MKGYNTIGDFLLTAIAIVVSLTIHEYSHGLVSTLLGDKTPERYGRLTLNPLAHLDPIGLLSLFIFRFGWAKPIPIDSYYYKNKRFGIILTSIAGPLSNFILAFFSYLVYVVLKNPSPGIEMFLSTMVIINAGLAVFNLIPLPPLDGSKIIAEIFGGKIAELIYTLDRYGTFLLFALLWLNPVVEKLSAAINWVIDLLYMLVHFIV